MSFFHHDNSTPILINGSDGIPTNLSNNLVYDIGLVKMLPVINSEHNGLSIDTDTELFGHNYPDWVNINQSGDLRIYNKGDHFTIDKISPDLLYENTKLNLQALRIRTPVSTVPPVMYAYAAGQIFSSNNNYRFVRDVSITFAMKINSATPYYDGECSILKSGFGTEHIESYFNVFIKKTGNNLSLQMSCQLVNLTRLIVASTGNPHFSYPIDNNVHFYTVTLHCPNDGEDLSVTKLKLYVDGQFYNEETFVYKSPANVYGVVPGNIYIMFPAEHLNYHYDFLVDDELITDLYITAFNISNTCLTPDEIALLYDYVKGFKTPIHQNFVDNMFYSPLEHFDCSFNSSYTKNLSQITTFATIANLHGSIVKHQISTDGGQIFKYWDGSAWVSTDKTDGTECNTDSEMDTNIKSLPITSENVVIRTFIFNEQGTETPIVNGYRLTLNYNSDDDSGNDTTGTPIVTIDFNDGSDFIFDDTKISFDNGCAGLKKIKRDSLLYFYEFKEANSYHNTIAEQAKILDSSDNHLNADVAGGGTLFADTYYDKRALFIDPAQDTIMILNNDNNQIFPQNRQELTYSLWLYKIKIENVYGHYFMRDAGPGTSLQIVNGSLSFFVWASSLNNFARMYIIYLTAETTPANEWFNITVTVSTIKNQGKLYLNGELIDTQQFQLNWYCRRHPNSKDCQNLPPITECYMNTVGDGTHSMKFFGWTSGKNNPKYRMPFKGYVSNLALLNEYLSEQEVQNVYNYPDFIAYSYPTSKPSIYLKTPLDTSEMYKIISFEVTYCDDNEEQSLFQISKDGGASWLYWNGQFWNEALNNEKNTEQEINDNIQYLDMGDATGFNVKTFLISDGLHNNIIKSITIKYKARKIIKHGIKFKVPIYHTTQRRGMKFGTVFEVLKDYGIKFGVYAWRYIDRLKYKGDAKYDSDKTNKNDWIGGK